MPRTAILTLFSRRIAAKSTLRVGGTRVASEHARREMMRRRFVVLVILAIAVAVVAYFGAPLGRAAVALALDALTGYRVAFERLSIGPSQIALGGLTVSNVAGEPVVAAARVSAAYDLGDLMRGRRRLGLVSLEIERPRLRLFRHTDGTFSVPFGGAGSGGGRGGGSDPWHFAIRVRDGGFTLADPNRRIAIARELSLEALQVSGEIDTRARSTYRLTGNVGGFGEQAFALAGRVDSGGYAIHRLTARTIAIAPLVDYLINSHAAEVTRGLARDLDVRAYAFGNGAYHLAGSALLVHGDLHVPGMIVTARELAGRIDLSDDGIASSHLVARLGAVPVRLAGGLYDWNAPAFRLGIVADAPLGDVRGLFAFSQNLPLAGEIHVETFLESAVGSPLVVVVARAPSVSYGIYPIEHVAARAEYYDSAVDLASVRAGYGDLATSVGGSIALGDVARPQLVVGVAGSTDHVPYAAQLAPHAALSATGLIEGRDVKLDARGVAVAAGASARLSGLFHVDQNGDGAFGPIVAVRDDGSSAMGIFYLDRSEGRSGFWVDARDYAIASVPANPRLPGLAFGPPVFGGRLDGAVAGYGPPSDFRIAGSAHARAFTTAGLRVDDVRANLAGTFEALDLQGISANGPWGRFRGRGSYAQAVAGRPQTLALQGAYRGSFAQLRGYTGNIAATGPIDGPVALVLTPERTIVQARADRTPGARVEGVPVDGLTGTLAVVQQHVRIYAATARVGGGRFAAAGTLDGARGVGVSVADAQAARFAAIAPVGSARIAAIGTFRASAHASRFDGGVAVGGGSVARLALAGNGELSLSGSRVDVRSTDALVGPAYGELNGTMSGLGMREPFYDLALRVPSAPVAPFARALAPSRHDIAGTAGGELRIRGTRATLGVAGSVEVPEGTVNGLAFGDARFAIAIDPSAFIVRDGHVTVGSTELDFGGRAAARDVGLRLHTGDANLADFNDYFDTGDTLGGTGSIDVHFRKRGAAVRTRANLAIAGLRYRRFDLGNAGVHWISNGRAVTGAASFGGHSGLLDAAGTLTVASSVPLQRVLQRSYFDGKATLRSVDLGVWLPALGYQLPIGGRIDAAGTIAGELDDPRLVGTATLAHGTLGKFPVDRLEVSADATLRRTHIKSFVAELPSISMTGAGTFGAGLRDPIAFALHAKSPDVGAITSALLGKAPFLSGAGEADLKISGTRAVPQIVGGFDLENGTAHGVAIPQALGEFTVRGRNVVLSGAEVTFAKGSVQLAGSLPLRIAPFGFGPESAQVALDLRAADLSLDDFAPLLPTGSTLQGALDGHLAIGGTAGNPRIDGMLALAGGTLRAPFETIPLSAIAARLRFDDNVATLESLHAESGSGRLDAAGTFAFGSLSRSLASAPYHLEARADAFALDVPAFVSGQLDGTASLTHEMGSLPLLAAKLGLTDAVIPFSALLLADSGGSGGFDTSTLVAPPPAPAGPNIALALDLAADRNVRVRSGNVDIGARGNLSVSGTRAAPQLSGTFVSTGGTITYFNTVFRLLDGTVGFRPDLGVIPTLDATAVAHVLNPDPNTVRNVSGSADVYLAVTGQVTSPSITLTSDPVYDREQILGLLLSAPALGASTLFGDRGQATLYGSTTPAQTQSSIVGAHASSTEIELAQQAFGVANAQFTRTLLSPIETSVASAIGLSNINVNVDYTGAVGLTARKVLGKQVNVIYGTSFGYPYRQTFGFEIKPGPNTAAQVTVFDTLGAYNVDQLTPAYGGYFGAAGSRIQAAEPLQGTAGFSLSLQRLFP